MEYTQPITTGTHPSPRSWHTAVTLPGKRMLIHGGYNGIKTLSDAFMFDMGEYVCMFRHSSITVFVGHDLFTIN